MMHESVPLLLLPLMLLLLWPHGAVSFSKVVCTFARGVQVLHSCDVPAVFHEAIRDVLHRDCQCTLTYPAH